MSVGMEWDAGIGNAASLGVAGAPPRGLEEGCWQTFPSNGVVGTMELGTSLQCLQLSW